MTDYTPTTEQVRDGYRFDPEDDYYNPLQAGANAERAGRAFDRWLERTLREARAEAWEEGFVVGERSGERELPTNPHTANPYRKEQS